MRYPLLKHELPVANGLAWWYSGKISALAMKRSLIRIPSTQFVSVKTYLFFFTSN